MNSEPLGRSAFSCYGIELEYAIVNADQLDIRPIANELLIAMNSEQSDLDHSKLECSHEFVNHVIEIKNNQPFAELSDLTDLFQEKIRQVNDYLFSQSARLMPTGMHPWMDPCLETELWSYDDAQLYELFSTLFDVRSHGWANLQSMHINLPFLNEEEFVRLHSAIRLVLPILPAIAASSPIACGELTGFSDFRLEAYRHNSKSIPSITGSVIPEAISSYQDYHSQILRPMYQAIAPFDVSGLLQHEWLNARGAIARFDRNTIEIRLLDTQENVAVDLAIASAVTEVTRDLYESELKLEQLLALSTQMLTGILHQCIQQAELASIQERDYLELMGVHDSTCEAKDLWRKLLDKHLQTGGRLVPWQEPLQKLLEQGTLAHRICKAANHDYSQARLQTIYAILCNCLAEGKFFDPNELRVTGDPSCGY